jgi:hypothetical protein
MMKTMITNLALRYGRLSLESLLFCVRCNPVALAAPSANRVSKSKKKNRAISAAVLCLLSQAEIGLIA